ncbi:carbohydrate sulfotransferase 1-like [Lytechinus variegatus]|uniref:carbohydrate sulfotransferase 1-like n=1 Tax=Lytechinus variegatus TaxID=7654 RepID=UPI001BB10062|nr:carbohydrate sulfotransferase 1-like [Lytechinus variegatus]
MNGILRLTTMMSRKRRCCYVFTALAFTCACSVVFPPRDMRSVFTDYLTRTHGETRRLLQNNVVKSASTAEIREVPKKEASKNEKEKYRVPIFWDDGEFMNDDELEKDDDRRDEEKGHVVEAKSALTEPHVERNKSTNVGSGAKDSVKSNQSKNIPGKTQKINVSMNDGTMAVLDYKMSQFQTVKSAVKSQSEETGETNETTNRVLPVHLLIVTQRRSGSSFLGQIFNQNPWVFFHFEPLKLLEIKKRIYPNASYLLQHLLKCRFDKTPYLTDFYNNETLHRMSSKVLCSPPLCMTNVDYNSMRSSTVKKCNPLDPKAMASLCNLHPHKVVKLIRLYSVESLTPLLKDKSINLKIIHLLRDPRGTLSSRSKENHTSTKELSLGNTLTHDATYICRRMKRNFNFVQKNPELLRDRYLRIRYEDIATDPEGWTRDLYKFAGIGDVPGNVYDWIQQNTHESTSEDARDIYSTHRNSSANAQAWRHHVTFPVVSEIQNHCGGVMEEAGYRLVKEASDLQRTNLSFVSPIT